MTRRFHRPVLTLLLAVAAGVHLPAQEPLGRAQIVHAQEGMIWAVMVPLIFITAICGLVYLGRAIIDHRRWLRATTIEADAYHKIVDRLSASEDLLAYIQSTGDLRLPTDLAGAASGGRGAAPAARILWSVQTGIVLTLAGAGLWIGANQADHALEEIADVLHMVAVLVIAAGIGFVLSAAVSLTLSRRLGLLETPTHSPS